MGQYFHLGKPSFCHRVTNCVTICVTSLTTVVHVKRSTRRAGDESAMAAARCFVQRATHRPHRGAALVLGWAESEARHISKYASLYASLGFDTVFHATSLPEGFYSAAADSAAKAVAERLEHDAFVMHALSGAGLFVGLHVLRAAPQLKLRGTVLDSSALHMDRHQAGRGIASVCPPALQSEPWGSIVTSVASLLVQPIVADASLDPQRVVLSQSPVMVLHSDSDEICPTAPMEAFARKHPSAGSYHEFAGAPHVGLLRQDPERYRGLLSDFVASVAA